VTAVTDAFEHCRSALVEGGFVVEDQVVDGLGDVLIAETRYALVMVVSADSELIGRQAEQAQAHLTRLAARHPSPLAWDLYLVLALASDHIRPDGIVEGLLGDTRYARKLVVAGDLAATERGLRALMPLRSVPRIELTDPLGAVRDYLVGAEVDIALADAALTAFEASGEVEIP